MAKIRKSLSQVLREKFGISLSEGRGRPRYTSDRAVTQWLEKKLRRK